MQNLQEIFDRMQEAKKEQRDIRKMYKDALTQTPGYTDVAEDLKALRDKKKRIETAVKEQFASEMTRLDDLKIDIESDQELLNDIAITKVMKGELVEVKGKDEEEEYEPIFSVKFKKVR